MLISSEKNEVLIIGGTKKDGSTVDVYNHNLKHWTLGSYPKMNKKRTLHKGFTFQGEIFVIGGESNGTVESFDIAKHRIHNSSVWKMRKPIDYKGLLQCERKIMTFASA